jgi:hypothetical protein
MATNKTPRADMARALIARAMKRPASSRKEQTERESFDLARRQAATTILHPHEVSGEYDAGRVLVTSRRGTVRPITLHDIRAFQTNVANLKKKFIGGIKAQAVIDLSMPVDRDRANAQIHMAVPSWIKGNKIKFITNSGPDSKVSRHHVDVEFIDFEGAVGASPNDAKKAGKLVVAGRLRFQCDCERFTFVYRYIATTGKYVLGRSETGFPKLTNPRLEGVACKHALRVMHAVLKDARVHTKVGEQVFKSREVLDSRLLKAERTKAADLRTHADEQASKGRVARTLKTSTTKAAEAAKRKARTDMARKAAGKLPVSPTKGQLTKEQSKLLASMRDGLAKGYVTQAMLDTVMANMGVTK